MSRRFVGGFAAVIVVALAGSGYGAWSLNKVSRQTETLVQNAVKEDRLIADWFRNVAVTVRRTTAIAVSADPSLADFFAKEAAETTKSIIELQEKISEMLDDDNEKRIYAEIIAVRKTYMVARDGVFQLKRNGEAQAARRLLDESYLPLSVQYLGGLQRLSDLQRAQIDAAAQDVQSINKRAERALIAFAAVALIAGGFLAWVLARSITQPIQRAVQVAGRIARLDLTERIESHDRDETGRLLQSLDVMQTALKRLVGDVRGSTESITTASAEIADGNMDLSARTESAASSLQQTAASMEQMNATVQTSAVSARSASELAENAMSVAVKGGDLVGRVVSTMEGIDRSSKKIVDIIGVIDGIAFQTNILALNAAVEAARAGEQGRGFAVVASEVRNLAQRSAGAAKEIKTLIGESVGKVASGSELVGDAGQTMLEIVSSVRRVSTMIAEISTAASEQSAGLGQVNTAVAQLDQMTQQNAALVEQSAAAAASLKAQAHRLAETVQQFRI